MYGYFLLGQVGVCCLLGWEDVGLYDLLLWVYGCWFAWMDGYLFVWVDGYMNGQRDKKRNTNSKKTLHHNQ